MIYFVLSRSGHVKIGYVKRSLFKRFRLLQVGNPHPITLIGLQKGDKKREAEIHSMFRKWRYRSEWFHQSREILTFACDGGFLQHYRDEIDKCFGVTVDDTWKVFEFERGIPECYDNHPMRTLN